MDDVEKDRREILKNMQINFGENVIQLTTRYCNSTGQHEVLDRTFILQESMDSYVRMHPYIVLSPELFRLADEINEKLAELYTSIAQD